MTKPNISELSQLDIKEAELDVLKRLQNGALELLAIELRDTDIKDSVTRGEVLDDISHRLGYLVKQVSKIKAYNEEVKKGANQ